jgi:amidase
VLAAVGGADIRPDAGRLRIAYSAADVHPDCRRAVEETARLCAELGHAVDEAEPDVAALEADFLAAYVADAAAIVDRWAELMERAPRPSVFEPLTWAVYRAGRDRRPPDLEPARARVASFFATHDVWLSPTLAAPPERLGPGDTPADDPLAPLVRDLRRSSSTWLANLARAPAMSVPLSWNAGGLPVGSHFIGRPGEDATLLGLAAQLEAARPWTQRRPRLETLSQAAG